jgi:hypothetical protein
MTTLTKTATGFVAQDKIMTYATPGIEHLERGFGRWRTAAGAGGLDWEPTSRPVHDVLTGTNLPGIRATWNGPRFLGVVTDVHRLISHQQLGKVVKAIMGMYPDALITALVQLDGGKRIGVRITHEEFYLPGDESPIQKEAWVWLRHDAKGSLAVIENAQRMFCTNQLGSYSGAATELFVRHTGDVEEKVAELVTKLTARRDDWKLWEQEMATLQATPVRNGQFDWFTKLYIPEPVPPVSNTRALSAQGDLYAQWAKYSEELGPNAYAGFQAIVEFEDKARASRGAVSRFQRAIQPNPNKQRGLRMLMEVAR